MRPGAVLMFTFFFFFNDTATTEIYTLSLHDALPISFGCRVHDSYGSAEMVALVTECDRGRLHVSPEVGVVEVLRDGRPVGPGEAGELVCTGLLNEAMPLIRYRTGDVAVQGSGPCPCGRPPRAL